MTLLPQPLSPAMPSVSPRCIIKLTPSTALITPSREKNPTYSRLVVAGVESVPGAIEVGLEVLARAHQHLLGRHGTAGVAAHSVSQHGHHHAGPFGMRKKAGAILLLSAITDMHGDTGFG